MKNETHISSSALVYVHWAFLLVVTSAICCNARVEPSNRLFRLVSQSEQPSAQIDETTFPIWDKNKYAAELLPSVEDIGGNWGSVTNGVQLSVRLYRTNFLQGEPIFLVVLWRNVGQAPAYFTSATWENYDFDLLVRRDNQPVRVLLPRLDSSTAFDGSAGGEYVNPRTQMRFVIELDKIVDVGTPGTYSVSAQREDQLGGGTNIARIVSGTARFTIAQREAREGVKP